MATRKRKRAKGVPEELMFKFSICNKSSKRTRKSNAHSAAARKGGVDQSIAGHSADPIGCAGAAATCYSKHTPCARFGGEGPCGAQDGAPAPALVPVPAPVPVPGAAQLTLACNAHPAHIVHPSPDALPSQCGGGEHRQATHLHSSPPLLSSPLYSSPLYSSPLHSSPPALAPPLRSPLPPPSMPPPPRSRELHPPPPPPPAAPLWDAPHCSDAQQSSHSFEFREERTEGHREDREHYREHALYEQERESHALSPQLSRGDQLHHVHPARPTYLHVESQEPCDGRAHDCECSFPHSTAAPSVLSENAAEVLHMLRTVSRELPTCTKISMGGCLPLQLGSGTSISIWTPRVVGPLRSDWFLSEFNADFVGMSGRARDELLLGELRPTTLLAPQGGELACAMMMSMFQQGAVAFESHDIWRTPAGVDVPAYVRLSIIYVERCPLPIVVMEGQRIHRIREKFLWTPQAIQFPAEAKERAKACAADGGLPPKRRAHGENVPQY
eukprot:TRINITY_DN5525_c0_g3_i2.p1 TRINITY_DN5525_c0_g3~~TRINITY_DN5525_c0_g3_i2.p1  ORF type:complete len:534 (-),score=103.17 TRINITY_DN5525_c0_g3_i2:189-1685(-)